MRGASTRVLLRNKMTFAEAWMLLGMCFCIFILSVLFPWTIYYAITRRDLPPGFKQRAILQAIDTVRDFIFAVEMFLVKLGLSKEFAFMRWLFDGIPPSQDSSLLIKDLIFDTVPVRVYWPKNPVAGQRRGLLYIHGGAGLFGSIRGYERICRCMARESGTVVVSVGYCLAPEHPYPVPTSDCLTAAIHFLKHAKDYRVDSSCIIIGGDSIGATYSSAIAQELATRADLPRFRAQILLFPFLQALDFNLPSYQQYHSSPILSKKMVIEFGFRLNGKKITNVDGLMKNAHVPEAMKEKYSKWVSADLIPPEFKIKGSEPPELAPFSKELYEMSKPIFETRFSPLLADDEVIRQLPETFILTCEYDVLRDDGLLYKKRLEDNGVPVTWHHAQDGFHANILVIDYPFIEFQSTRNAFRQVIQFLKGL